MNKIKFRYEWNENWKNNENEIQEDLDDLDDSDILVIEEDELNNEEEDNKINLLYYILVWRLREIILKKNGNKN